MKRAVVGFLASVILLFTCCAPAPHDTGTLVDTPSPTVFTAEEEHVWSGIDEFSFTSQTPLPEQTFPLLQESTSAPAISSGPVQTPGYRALSCRAISFSDMLQSGISFASGGRRLALPLPEDWVIETTAASVIPIRYNGRQIGTISSTLPHTPLEKYEIRARAEEDLQAERAVHKVQQDGKTEYKRVYSFTDTVNKSTIYISFDYTQMDDAIFLLLFENAKIPQDAGDTEKVTLLSDASDTILILGNSFIGTSEIGVFLEQFLQRGEKKYHLQAVSRGYASVEDYAQEEWLQQIRAGKYCVVFQCGLYAPNDVEQFIKVKQACEFSNTRLVLFPAHNENKSFIQQIQSRYPDVICLSWQEEIDRLIESPRCRAAYADFCIDDAHQHTKPLGGYVGAHLIYRALFQEIPPRFTGNYPMPMQEISMLLGSYTDTGKIEEIVFDKLYALK